jgi:hypothetical protein
LDVFFPSEKMEARQVYKKIINFAPLSIFIKWMNSYLLYFSPLDFVKLFPLKKKMVKELSEKLNTLKETCHEHWVLMQ